jgi:hypothetical protein
MRAWAGWPAAAALCLVAHSFWQGHGVLDPAFRNPDVAGIAYNARLFAAGALPYVQSQDIKPPGAFMLFAPLIELGGMRAVWGAAIVWGALLSLATGALAQITWGRVAGPRAAVLHAACAAIASDGDINYSFWMATPFTLAATCACAGAVTAAGRRVLGLWLCAGALALLAVAIKPSAWPLGGLFAVLLGRDVVQGRTAKALASAGAGLLGATLSATLLALPYLVRGELRALQAGLADVSAFGHEYVGVVTGALGGRAAAVWAGMPCLIEQLPGPLVLATLGASNLFRPSGTRPPLGLAAWAFVLAAFVGTTYTLRFFSHDNAQLWPALALIAVRPAGLLAHALDLAARVPVLPLPAAALVGLTAAWPGFDLRWGFVHYMAERDHMVDDICKELLPHLPPDDPVLGWGWSAWSVYEHCQRRAPGRVFKVVATVTTVNTNTCNNGFGPMLLRAGPEPARFLADVTAHPPSLFLWSSYFSEMGGDPLDDWSAMREFVKAHYALVDARGPFVALLRNDLLPPPGSGLSHGDSPWPAPFGGSGSYGSPSRAGSVWTSTSRTPENWALMASITQCVTR